MNPNGVETGIETDPLQSIEATLPDKVDRCFHDHHHAIRKWCGGICVVGGFFLLVASRIDDWSDDATGLVTIVLIVGIILCCWPCLAKC